MNQSVLGLSHIGLHVRNLERSKKFYTGILGFAITCTAPLENGTVLCFLRNGDCEIELIAKPDYQQRQDGHFEHLCLKTADLDAAIAHLGAHGIPMEGPARSISNVYHGVRLAFFRGPDGELLELNEFADEI